MKRSEVLCRQFLCVIPICTVFVMVGIARSWVAPILAEASDPHSELPLSTEQCSLIASFSGVTQALCPTVFLFLVDRMGRKPVIVLNAILSLAVWLIVYGSRNVFAHYVARLLCGLHNGMHYMVASIYIGENCSPELRGTFSTLGVLCRYAGHTTVYLLATFCTYNQSAVVYCALALVTVLSTLLTLETPQYLLMEGESARAEVNFARLRDMRDANAVREFEAMKENIEYERGKKSLDLATVYRSKEASSSVCVVMMVAVLFTGTGWVAVNSFMTTLFSDPNHDGLSPNELSLYCSLFHLLSVGVSSAFIDKVNRRTLMIASSALASIMLGGITLLYYIQSAYPIPGFQLLLFVLFTLFSCLETGLMFPLMSMLGGELLPQSVKRTGVSISMFTSGIVFYVNNLTFLLIAEAFGMVMNFVTYLAFAVSLTVFVYYRLPETRGKTLVQIQNELKGVVIGRRLSN